MEERYLIDHKGQIIPADGQGELVAGRQGYFRLQNTSPDWVLLTRQPSQGGVQDRRPRIVLAGDCATFAVQDLIAFLGQARWTGVMRVVSPSGERSLLIKDGDVRSGSSDSPADRIGEVMVRLGYISRKELAKVLAEAPPSRLGRVLVERGVIKAHDLYKCLNEQIAEIFHGMMLSREGTFVLVDQELDEKLISHNLSASMQGLLMDSIRKIDELAQFRKKIPNGNLYPVKKKPSDGKLEQEEDQLLALVDGQHSVLELGLKAKLSEFDATRITYRLLEGGYVKMAEAALAVPGPAASAPPPPQPAPAAASDSGTFELEVAEPETQTGATAHTIIEVFNTIFRQVRDEVAQRGNLDMFLASANAALKGSGVSTSPVLNGLSFGGDGSLDPDAVLQRFEALRGANQLGSEPLVTLKQGMSDVMFFLLFQAGEMLESRADEDLARRVRELLATIDAR